MAAVVPGDEREDVRGTLAWLRRTDDVFRRVKPATVDRHLVSYVVPVDPRDGSVLLGEHLNAGLWLPPDGHVEVDEHPAVTARWWRPGELAALDPGSAACTEGRRSARSAPMEGGTRLVGAAGSATMTPVGRTRMHADEVGTDVALVRRLLAGQFPEWAGLPIDLVDSYGTDHDIYRLGGHLAARLPRVGWATRQAALEAEWLPRLAPHLPLAVPVQLAIGRPAEGYPYDWSVYEWLRGENATGTIEDLDRAAVDLAAFIRALRGVDTTGAHPRPSRGRGGPLAEQDEQVRESITQLGDRIDGDATLRSWQESLDAPAWDGPEVWVHGDLLPGNLLVVDGRLSAVIDFGALNLGDPACDLQPAWNLFAGDSRRRFRAELGVDDASWLRGRGWALNQAVQALPYYWDTNPGMIRQASHALAQVLADSRDAGAPGATAPPRT